MKESYFNGGLAGLIGWSILGFLINVFTSGIYYPWIVVMMVSWRVNHT
jgi:uncharacterized membrane protein YjgN (DUF898 family)